MMLCVMFKWYDCNSTDCSLCDKTIAFSWITPISLYDEFTEESCDGMEFRTLPPYSQGFNFTALSFRFTEDPSPYTQILVENCYQKCIAVSQIGIVG